MTDVFDIHEKLRASGVLIGGMHRAEAVDEHPKVVLRSWQVIRLIPVDTIHFYGYDTTRGEGRVSSPVLQYDPETREGVTRSGRRYELLAGEGRNPDAEYVLGMWLGMQGIGDQHIERITSQYTKSEE